MRILLVALLTCGNFGNLQAAVVDRLQCRMRYAPTRDGRVVETTADVVLPRRQIAFNSSPNVTLTEAVGDLSTVVQAERFQGALHLVSLHAVKRSTVGLPARAAQHVCLSHTVLIGSNGVSSDCRPACEDPFDARCKWAAVELRNGIPAFEARTLQPVTQPLGQGIVSLSCRYDGTLE